MFNNILFFWIITVSPNYLIMQGAPLLSGFKSKITAGGFNFYLS